MVTVFYNIQPKSDIGKPFLVEKMARFDNVVDAKMFVDRIRKFINKHYTIIGKPVIN